MLPTDTRLPGSHCSSHGDAGIGTRRTQLAFPTDRSLS